MIVMELFYKDIIKFEEEGIFMKKMFYGWWIVIGSAIMLGVTGPASVAVANLYQGPVTEEFGIASSMFAIVNTIVLGMGIFLSPFISQQLTKPGNFKRVMAIGITTYGLAYAGYGLAPNIWVFYILSVFVGIGFLVTNVMHASIIVSNWFEAKRGTAISLSLTGLGFGGIVFSQLVTILINNVGWRQTYMIYGAIILVVGLAINFFVYKEKPEDMGLTALGASEAEIARKSEEKMVVETGVSMPIQKTFNKGFFIALLVGSILIGIANNAGLGQFPPYLTGLHGAVASATIVSIYSGVGILGKIALGIINDKIGVVKSVLYATVLLIVTYALMTSAGVYSIAIIAAVLFGMGNAIGTVMPPLITADIYASNNYGKAYGFMQSGIQLGMTVGSLIAATIADSMSYPTAWIAIAVLTALGGISWIYASISSKKYA